MGEATLKEALYWEAGEGGAAHCLLCPHACRLGEGEVGRCRVRQNVDGKLRSLNYNRISSAQWDPIEKKPLFHFHPGTPILSLGTTGCNLSCAFCQNWSISQASGGTRRMGPEEAVSRAGSQPANIGIAYTYNEPLVWYEFVAETAHLVRGAGMKNVLVTNGFINEGPLRALLPYIDALNVDIKSMRPEFYRELCRGTPEPPRRAVEVAKEYGCLVEVTNLLIPNWNDGADDVQALVDWAAGIDPQMPMHFSRYHPDYKLTEAPTPVETLVRAREMAREKMNYVYVGNISIEGGEDTLCPSCGTVVIARRGLSVTATSLDGDRCRSCGAPIPIIGI